jgi:hypothetical protein
VIVKHITRDQDKIYLEIGRLLTDLLEGHESRLTDPVAGFLLKPCDPEA